MLSGQVTSEFMVWQPASECSFADAEKRVLESLKDAEIISIEVENEFYQGKLTGRNFKIKANHTLNI